MGGGDNDLWPGRCAPLGGEVLNCTGVAIAANNPCTSSSELPELNSHLGSDTLPEIWRWDNRRNGPGFTTSGVTYKQYTN